MRPKQPRISIHVLLLVAVAAQGCMSTSETLKRQLDVWSGSHESEPVPQYPKYEALPPPVERLEIDQTSAPESQIHANHAAFATDDIRSWEEERDRDERIQALTTPEKILFWSLYSWYAVTRNNLHECRMIVNPPLRELCTTLVGIREHRIQMGPS